MSNPVEAPATVRPKEDPQKLVLRGRPRPVVRFRRGMIIGISGAVAATVAGLSWMSLQPAKLRSSASATDSSEPNRKPVPDALANVPSNYGGVPRLGPLLPGDLGGPILQHERSLAGEDATPVLNGAGPSEQAQDRSEAEQRRVAEREAARSSPVIVQLQKPTSTSAATAEASEYLTSEQPAAKSSAADGAPSSRSGLTSDGQSKSEQAGLAGSSLRLNAGTIIPASLLTGLNSDLPGTVIAQVTQDVCDSATGRRILIPQGARLIGTYDSASAYGQRRALLVWKSLVFPDGSSIKLDNIAATDASGYTGIKDGVDSHTWTLLKGIVMSTLLGVGTQLSIGNDRSELVRALRESAQQNASDAGSQITSRNLDIRPTITVRPGWPVRAIVDQDLVVPPWPK